MSEHIARLCDQLRIKLHGIDRRLEALKVNSMATSRPRSTPLRASWIRSSSASTTSASRSKQRTLGSKPGWKERRPGSMPTARTGRSNARCIFNTRADDAEAYAVAVFDLAAAAADEAAQAALEALLARNDANIARPCRSMGQPALRAIGERVEVGCPEPRLQMQQRADSATVSQECERAADTARLNSPTL